MTSVFVALSCTEEGDVTILSAHTDRDDAMAAVVAATEAACAAEGVDSVDDLDVETDFYIDETILDPK